MSTSSAVASLEAVLYWHSNDGVGDQLPTVSGQKNWASCRPPQEVLDGRGSIPEVTDRTGRMRVSFGRKMEAVTLTCIVSQFHHLARAGCSNHWLVVCKKANL